MRFSIAVLLGTSLFACRTDNSVKAYNTNPEVSISSHADGASILEGYPTEFRAQVSDANHGNDELEVAWYVGTELACDWSPPSTAGESSCETALSLDDTALIVEVRDPEGAGGRDEIALSVTATESPEVVILSPTADGSYYADQLISFKAAISDAEDATTDLSSAWESALGGASATELTVDTTPDSNDEIEGFAYLPEGEHALVLRVTDLSGKTTSESVIITVKGDNNAPLCSIEAPDGGLSFVQGQSIEFLGTATDQDINNSQLTIRWESDIDGLFNTATANTDGSLAFSHDALSIGAHAISLKVEDEVGAQCQTSVQLTVGTPPSVSLTAPAYGDVYTLGEGILFSATVSDGEDTPDQVTLSWVSDIDGTFSTQAAANSGTAQFIDDTLSAGEHTLVLTATDTDGLSDTALLSFKVNTPPTAPSVSIEPNPANTLDTLNAIASGATDADGDTVNHSYLWFQNGVQTAFVSSTIAPSNTAANDEWLVRVTPNDGQVDGPYTEANIVISNSPPSLDSIAISPGSGVYNDSVLACTASGTDADESLSPTYSWTVNGQSFSGQSLDLSSTNAQPTDSVSCTATVTDSAGDSDSATTTITVENRAPTVSSVTISPNTGITTDSTISCSATATDDDGESPVLSYEWTLTTTGANLGTGANLTLSSNTVSPGDSLSCTATAVDSYGESGTASQTVTVENTEPVISAIDITPTNPSTSDTLTCIVTASDDDGDTLTDSYVWTNLSTATPLGTGPNLTLSPATAQPGDFVDCTATVDDGMGQDWAANAVIVANTAPVIDSIAITPNTVIDTQSLLTCNASASDADGQSINLMTSWKNDTQNTTIGSGTTLQLDPNLVQPNDSVSCIVVAMDPNNGSAIDSATVSIENTPPTVSGLAISPSSPLNNDTLTCTATVDDPDESPTVAYVWTNQSTGMILGGGDTLSLNATVASPGDIIDCTVYVSDSQGANASDSATALVDNIPPEVVSVTLSPSSVATNDLLTATAVLSDADATQSLTADYAWHVIDFDTGIDSLVQSGADNTLDGGAHFDRDDTVYVEVTANDGMTNGAPLFSSMLTVENTAPGAASISLSPNPAVAGQDDLICAVDTPASDDDVDAISYTYVWTDPNGLVVQTSGQAGTGSDVYTGANTIEGTWTCEATPFDGTDYGPVSTATAQVESNCSSMAFDGSANLEVSDSTPLALSSVTMEAWVKPTSLSTNGSFIINKKSRNMGGHVAYGLGQNQDAFMVRFQVANCNACNSSHFLDLLSDKIAVDSWYHLLATYDESTGKGVLYVNGNEVDSDTKGSGLAYTNTAEPLGMGSTFVSGFNSPEAYWTGHANAIRLYDQSLSATDAADLFAGLTAAVQPVLSYSGTINGNLKTDGSGYGHDAVVNGVTELGTCPQEDNDGDGYTALEDCDDNDASVTLDCCQSLYFDGNDDYVLIGDQPEISNLNSITFGAWIKLEAHNNWQTIIGKYDNDNANQGEYLLQFSANEVRVVYHTGNSMAYKDAFHGLAEDAWMHIATSYDGTDQNSFKLYINGVEMNFNSSYGSISGGMGDSAEPLFIGARQDANIQFFNGHIRDVAIYDRALGQSEIEMMMSDMSAVSGLVGGWPLNHQFGSVATDISGNGLDGVVTGAIWENSCPNEDQDGDGYTAWEDCDDTDPAIHPLAGDSYGDGIDSDCDGFDCEAADDGFGTYFSVCIESTQLDFIEVHDHCIAGGHDGVSLPLNSIENDYIFDLSLDVWANKPVSNYSIRLGGTDAANEGTWLHDRTGLPMTYFNWPSNGAEPNNGGGGEHCINMIGDIGYNGLWQDLGCASPSNAAYAWSCETR